MLNSLLSSYSVSFNHHDNSEKIIPVPILWTGNRRLREVRSLAQCSSAKWSWVQDSNHKVGNFQSVQFSRSVVSDSFRPHELQHAIESKYLLVCFWNYYQDLFRPWPAWDTKETEFCQRGIHSTVTANTATYADTTLTANTTRRYYVNSKHDDICRYYVVPQLKPLSLIKRRVHSFCSPAFPLSSMLF